MSNPLRKSWSLVRQAIYRHEPVNWMQTWYFNLKFFPFAIARKLPVIFYRRVRIVGINGKITINAPVTKGMLSFGKPFERFSRSMGIAEIGIDGHLILNGRSHFSMDNMLYVYKDGTLELGDRFHMGSRGKLICTHAITIKNDVTLSYESQLFDSNFHRMVNAQTGEVYPMSQPVSIGSYNFIANRCTLLPGTVTPDYCTVASNSVCSKDYSALGENTVIGGIPAKLIKTNTTRDWAGESDAREKSFS